MKRYEKQGKFRLSIPDTWIADEEEEPVSFYQPNGPGALQLTVQEIKLKVGEHVDPQVFLQSFMNQHGVKMDADKCERFKVRGGEGAKYETATRGPDGPLTERLWVLAGGSLILFFTYACRADEDRERAEVDGIVDGARILA